MMKFIFESYNFDKNTLTATFNYGFDDGRKFSEVIEFSDAIDSFDSEVLDRAMKLAHIIIGVSYYKTFPTTLIQFDMPIDEWQAGFFSRIYRNGLGQFAYENELTLADLVVFSKNTDIIPKPLDYDGSGIIALQSGGKDSLLTATMLKQNSFDFDSLYISSGENSPEFIKSIGSKTHIIRRIIDRDNLIKAKNDGALNGHVPVTYIVQSIALIQAILLGKNMILTSIAHEGEEPHAFLGDMPVTHQWSKTYSAEVDFAHYVTNYISSDIMIGSPLRSYSELKVAELFAKNVWSEFGHKFSSCNVANYKQGSDNTQLKWCGACPKCANSYLLFAPFIDSDELKSIFDGHDLFESDELQNDFKGLLGVDETMKPFECIGEVDELRTAYDLAQKRGGYKKLPFAVPSSDFEYNKQYDSQVWTEKYRKGF